MGVTVYFATPFALSGDKGTTIPQTDPGDGSINFANGFGPNYELNLDSDPGALGIPRDQTNQLYYDITLGIQQYQQVGVPNFISTSDNGGTPFPYTAGAMAFYSSNYYQSLSAANTNLPTVTSAWRLLDITGNTQAYSAAVFEGTVVNGDIVYWNNSTSQYTKAVANGTAAQQAVGIADVTHGRVLSFGLVAGLLTGLTANTVYYLHPTTPGTLTSTIPVNNVVQVGISKNTTDLFLDVLALPTVGAGTFQGASVAMTATQSFPGSSAVTKINFNTTGSPEYDTNGFWDNTNKRFTALYAGYYEITAALSAGSGLNTPAANGPLETDSLYLYKNGALFKILASTSCNVNGPGLSGTIIVKAAVNDYFELYIEHGDSVAYSYGTNLPNSVTPNQASSYQFKFMGF